MNLIKNRFVPAFLLTGTLLGVLIFTQFNTDVPIDSNFPADEIEARKEILNAFLKDQSYLQSRIVSLREQVEGVELDIEEQSEESNLNILNALQKDIGLTAVTGSGLEITLDDAPSTSRLDGEVPDESLVQASDLRDVVNLLFAAKAEAISINNQRVVATSPIASVGTTILVNSTFISPPFIINTVGDSDALSQRLYNSPVLKDLYSRKNELGLVFSVSGKSLLTVPIFNSEIKTNYLNLVE